MLERKRASKTYHVVPGDEEAGAGDGEGVELSEHMGAQESGVTTSGQVETNVGAELDNWDENVADDWDEEEPEHANGGAVTTDAKPKTPVLDEPVKSKRGD